jgi:major membrane immunogen (membrane-anchored lipoprotein)
MWKKVRILLLCMCMGLLAVSCKKDEGLKDGYYTAEMSDYSHGWKEYVTICVMEDKIVSVEYNAENASGFIKSWDIAYMKNMNSIQGTYPNKYTREYASQLLENQSADGIDAVSGASSSGGNFVRLAAAVLEKAQMGDSTVAIVESEKE